MRPALPPSGSVSFLKTSDASVLPPSLVHNPVPGRVVRGEGPALARGLGIAALPGEDASAHLKPITEYWASLLPHRGSLVVATCAIIPQESHWVSAEAPAFLSEFYLLISPRVTQPCQDLFLSYYLASVCLMASFLMILKQRDGGGR